MKKLISFIFITILLLGHTQMAEACSPSAGVVYPSVDSVLSQDNTAIGLYQMTSTGNTVPGILIIGNDNSIMNMTFRIGSTSCGDRFNEFLEDEYIVSIFNKNDIAIEHMSLDSQFSFIFTNKVDAFAKFDELSIQWNDRAIILGEISENGQIAYIASSKTLKPGMKDDNDVRALQSALKVKLGLGDEFKADGSYGPATIAIVKQFQISEGLQDDGIAGTLTQAKLLGAMIPNLAAEEPTGNAENSEEIESTTTENSEQVVNASEEEVNNDIFDAEIKKILIRAKNEIINYSLAGQNYNEAYSLVVKHNNDMLNISEFSDPLYKSSNGGQYFIYFAKLSNGKYVCVDNNLQKELLEKDSKPALGAVEVFC